MAKRRFLSSDYDKIAEYICAEMTRRQALEERKSHEALWSEVDRQVRMQAMERKVQDAEEDWRSAMELGDLSTASEVLSADVMRLIFPQDRSWMQAHTNIEEDRLQARFAVAGQKPTKKQIGEIQKRADNELRAFMTQQHVDFGLRQRIELSVKEALKHGSFVAEVKWEEIQNYSVGGVFKSAAAPVWEPHSMWNCYPETLNLNANLFYTGSMIFEWEKTYEWILQQKDFINLKKFKDATTDKKEPIKLQTFYGDITVPRETNDVFLPNMKIVVANKVVVYAQPNDTTQIIYGGYDRVDIRDPYYMSPLVKQSPNHKISSIIANRFLDNVELKLEPPVVYDANDPNIIKQGGVKIIPGFQLGAKGGAQNFKQVEIGDPSWAAEALRFFKQEVQEGTGVSSPRAGAQRQADRVTATQIEQEAHGSEVRTIDFVGKIEKGIKSYLYVQHELNKKYLGTYKFFNPEMGMKDFEIIKKADLPDEVHFEVVGSKGVITERRRAQATFETTQFLLSNEVTAGLVNAEAVAKQMYQDAGNKSPEQLLTVQDENDRIQKAVQEIQQQAEATIAQMQKEMQETAQKLVGKEMELKNSQDQLKLRNERALGTETDLRDQIKTLKDSHKQQLSIIKMLQDIKDERDSIKDEQMQFKLEQKDTEAAKEPAEPKESQPSVVVNLEKSAGYKVKRDENGDMTEVLPVDTSDTPEAGN